MKKREIFLYFSHKGKGSNFDNPHGFDHPSARGGHVVTTTEVGTTWTGDSVQDVPIEELFDGTNVGLIDQITRISVVSAGDNTGNRGSGYAATAGVPGGKVARSAADTVAGQVTVLADAAFGAIAGSAGSEKVSIKKHTGSAGDTTNGYTLAAGDEVRVERALKEGEAVVYPADMYIGATYSNATTTVLHFNSMLGKALDDTITVTHNAGKFKEVADLVKACAESNPYKAGMIKVIDLFSDPDIIAGGFNNGHGPSPAHNLGIINCVIAIA